MLTKLKQFRDMRSQAKDIQGALSKESVTANAAGGSVILTMDGTLNLTALAIDVAMMAPDKKEKLQQAIKDAHADALKKIQRIMTMKMKEMGGLPKMPGLS